MQVLQERRLAESPPQRQYNSSATVTDASGKGLIVYCFEQPITANARSLRQTFVLNSAEQT